MATAVGVAADAPRGHRRWPWIVSVVVLALALAGAAGAYTASRAKLFTPSHRLTSVTGETEAQAASTLQGDRFHLRVASSRSSTTVLAGHIVRQIPGPGTTLKEGSTVSVVLSAGPPPVAVPSLTGLTGDCPAAAAALTAAHLHAACTDTTNSMTVAKGTVISWTPMGEATEGSTITVVVSAGPPTETIPSLTGSTCTGATTALQAVQLVAQCTNAFSSTVPNGQVISWNPTGTALAGTTVAVSISEGPQPVVVPPLADDTVAEATTALQAVGLVPAANGPLVGHVFESTPASGTSVPPGTTVTIYLK